MSETEKRARTSNDCNSLWKATMSLESNSESGYYSNHCSVPCKVMLVSYTTRKCGSSWKQRRVCHTLRDWGSHPVCGEVPASKAVLFKLKGLSQLNVNEANTVLCFRSLFTFSTFNQDHDLLPIFTKCFESNNLQIHSVSTSFNLPDMLINNIFQ